MSVVIQSLLHNPFIKTWYLSEGHKSQDCERDACTSCALEEIFGEFWSAEKTEGYGAVPMLLASWKNSEVSSSSSSIGLITDWSLSLQHLAGYQQQDAHEYMQFILNSLHATHNAASSDSSSEHSASTADDCDCIIHKTFYGKLQSTVTCNECKNKTTALDPFMDLSLDLRSQVKKRKLNGIKKEKEVDAEGNGTLEVEMKLEECLARFTGEERLAKEDYRCVKCERQRDACKQLSVRKLPPVLGIHLKVNILPLLSRLSERQHQNLTKIPQRFSHTKDKSSKLDIPVTFPLRLDMVPYTTHHQHLPKDSNKDSSHSKLDASYLLSAVIVHKGEINSGHYVSYAREGKDWFLFDDSKVVLVGEGEVLAAQAYLLVYVVEKV